MLYLDASALMKRYTPKKGSNVLNERFARGEAIYTSVLSFGEIHAVIARAYRMKKMASADLTSIRETFLNDWLFGLSTIEASVHTMSHLPSLVENYPLSGADAIHLSAALWLKDALRLRRRRPLWKDELEFGAADKRPAQAATRCGLLVFNPEQFS